MLSFNDLRGILDKCRCRDYVFRAGFMGHGFFLQLMYMEPDISSHSLVPVEQNSRKWYISQHATTSEVVQTALKAVLTSEEHRTREHFFYKDLNIFYPHWDVEALCEARMAYKPCERKENLVT